MILKETVTTYGTKNLSDYQILSLIFDGGKETKTALKKSKALLEEYGNIGNLMKRINESPELLFQEEENENALLIKLWASFEMAKRSLENEMMRRKEIHHPEDVVEYLKMHYGKKSQEYFVVFFLNTKGRIIKKKELFIGTLNESLISVSTIFKEAILCDTYALVLAHNHPSGDTTPSRSDDLTTNRIAEAGNLMGIHVMDHIIVGKDDYFSYKQHDRLR